MSYLSTPPPQPLIISDDAVSLNANQTTLLVALTVYLYAFELEVPTKFSGAKWRIGTTATGSTDIGIYSFAGTLLANLGGVLNVASTNHSSAFSGGNVTLGPGQYFMALASANATDTYGGKAGLNTNIQSRFRSATNAATIPSTVVVLPATTGGFGTFSTNLPAYSLTVVGGL